MKKNFRTYAIVTRLWLVRDTKTSLLRQKLVKVSQHPTRKYASCVSPKLIEITGMADLVQLSGYYQYSPKITGIMTFDHELNVNLFWRILQSLARGIGIAKQLSIYELASLWTVEPENMFSYLQSLRSIGYEVRNHNTNSQIPLGKYLIPYAFPTLTPRSVQLRKSLGNINE